MKSVPITLFSFASEFYSELIAKTLFRLGYFVNVVKAPDLNCVPENIFKGLAVFLFGESIPSQDKICSLLTRANTTARFGIFVSEHTGLDVHLVDRLNEFSSWPCSGDELVLRLDRLGYSASDINYSESDKKILDELVSLNIIGKSPALLKTIHDIKKFTCCNAPLLIEGETRTGKELAARAVMWQQQR